VTHDYVTRECQYTEFLCRDVTVARKSARLLEMFVTVLIVAVGLLGTVTQAQLDTFQCLASNSVLMSMGSCYEAVLNVTERTHTPEQFTLACTNLQCKDLWENTIRNCFPVSGYNQCSYV